MSSNYSTISNIFFLNKKISLNIKKKYRLIIILIILTSIFEIINIGSVIPLIAILVNPEQITDLAITKKIWEFFKIANNHNINIKDYKFFIFLLFLITIILANLLRLALFTYSLKIAQLVSSDISAEIFKSSICKNYADINRDKSVDIINVIIQKVEFLGNLVFQIISFLSCSIIIFLYFLLLFFILGFKIVLFTVCIIGFSYFIIALYVNHKLQKNSQNVNLLSKERVKFIKETLANIKDILLNNDQYKYSFLFKNIDTNFKKAQQKIVTLAGIPRQILEVLFISVILFIAYFISENNNSNANETLVVLGLIGFSAQRLFPLIQNVYAAWATLIGNKFYLIDIRKSLEFNFAYNNSPGNLNFNKNIVLKNIYFTYDNSKNILNNFNFKINKGEKIAIIGASGKGKSTLVDIITGLLEPTQGSIYVDEKKIEKKNINDLRSKISHVPQEYFIIDDTIENNIAFTLDKKTIDRNNLIASAKIAELHDFIMTLPRQYENQVGEEGSTLSGGQRQRLAIARALYKKKEILILDEATSALDFELEERLIKNISSNLPNITLILITHRISKIKNIKKIINLDNTDLYKQ
jgi:ABC-type multidrug transport system fused ATPase/permease subunit